MQDKSLISELYYDIPLKNDLAVGIAFFNYTGSSRITMNYLYVVEKLKLAKIPYFTIEHVITGSSPRIKDAYHVYGSSYLFQKENLMRVLETKIPSNYTKLLFLDADILFETPNWYDMLSDLLEKNDVVHCFETAKWLDITYTKIQMEAFSVIATPDKHVNLLSNDACKYHSGFGWAFTRQWYNSHGFIDKTVIGSGDFLFVNTLLGRTLNNKYLTLYKTAREEWINRLTLPVIYTVLPVTVYHMFHGSLANRQYESRNTIFNGIENIEDIIYKNEYGVFELKDLSFNEKTYKYFCQRNDDIVE
jgi:hypothetical protein